MSVQRRALYGNCCEFDKSRFCIGPDFIISGSGCVFTFTFTLNDAEHVGGDGAVVDLLRVVCEPAKQRKLQVAGQDHCPHPRGYPRSHYSLCDV